MQCDQICMLFSPDLQKPAVQECIHDRMRDFVSTFVEGVDGVKVVPCGSLYEVKRGERNPAHLMREISLVWGGHSRHPKP